MKTAAYFLILTVAITVMMYFVAQQIVDSQGITLYRGVRLIYVFHGVLSVFVLGFILTVYYIAPKYTGFAFLGSSLFRLVGTVLFLLPLVGGKAENPEAEIMFFMPPYFLLTAIEAYFAVRLLQIQKNDM
ncbi:MAG: hypothetical protein Q4G08_00585 [Capnocytophaga sp.]|nr:hypothetical protein [Capnocytophaga sp.]